MVPAFENYIKSRFNALAHTADKKERSLILTECINACASVYNPELSFTLKTSHARYAEIVEAFKVAKMPDRLKIEEVEGYHYTAMSIPPVDAVRLRA